MDQPLKLYEKTIARLQKGEYSAKQQRVIAVRILRRDRRTALKCLVVADSASSAYLKRYRGAMVAVMVSAVLAALVLFGAAYLSGMQQMSQMDPHQLRIFRAGILITCLLGGISAGGIVFAREQLIQNLLHRLHAYPKIKKK